MTALAVQFATRPSVGVSMGCCWGPASPVYAAWQMMYQLAYQAAAEQARQERLSELFWEPNLN